MPAGTQPEAAGSPAPLVVLAGASSAVGIACARALLRAGLRVLMVGSDDGRIRAAAAAASRDEDTGQGTAVQAVEGGGTITALACDLADPAAVAELAGRIHAQHGPVDGLIHLVGGWRGGKTLADQTDSDWDFLHHSVLTTLRNTSRTFLPDIAASPVGRLAIVSSTSVTAPTVGNAGYAAIKAAAETWVLAIADSLKTVTDTGAGPEDAAADSGTAHAAIGRVAKALVDGATGAADGAPASAAVVLVVKALVDDAMRAAAPQRKFPGFTDVAVVGQTVADLFSTDAAALNGRRIILT